MCRLDIIFNIQLLIRDLNEVYLNKNKEQYAYEMRDSLKISTKHIGCLYIFARANCAGYIEVKKIHYIIKLLY